MSTRFYIYDAETGEELTDHPAHGRPMGWIGCSPVVNGERDRTKRCKIQPLGGETITADSYPRPVRVKYWAAPGPRDDRATVEIFDLVNEADFNWS